MIRMKANKQSLSLDKMEIGCIAQLSSALPVLKECALALKADTQGGKRSQIYHCN